MERQAQQEEATQNLTNLINQMKDREHKAEARRERNDPADGPSCQRVALAVSRAATTGGIPGYFGEQALLPQEQDLKAIFTSLGSTPHLPMNSSATESLPLQRLSG